MKIEEQIKKTVEGRVASRPSHEGAWERVQRRFRRQQRIRMTGAIAGAAAAITAVAIIVPQLGNDRTIFPIETPSAGPTGSSITSPTPVDVAAPGSLVAVDLGEPSTNADDRIVVISTATGKVIRVLAEAASGTSESFSPFVGRLSLSPDGATVYFARSGDDPACDRKIVSVPVSGGDQREVADGWSPALSPNGRYLAYQGKGTGPNCSHQPLMVRDLMTGEERRWNWAAEDPEDPYQSGGPFALSWAPDSRRIAFIRNVGDPLYELWVLDTTKGEAFLDARKVSPDEVPGSGSGEGWESPVFSDDSQVIAAQVTRWDHPDGPLHILVSFDPAEEESQPAVLFDPKSAVFDISQDPGSGVVLYATGEGLFRFEDGKAAQIVSGSYAAAVW